MLNLIVGVILGAMIGTVCTCLMVAASDADDREEGLYDEYLEKKKRERENTDGTTKNRLNA